ncbi:MAG: hypothetical protein J5974_02175 [Pyramidobacter sp.]|nr:hypothetical protein [Pyramidobacter sp.]
MKKFVAVVALAVVLAGSHVEAAENIVIKRGTEVLLKVMEKIKSNKVSEGQTIQFLVERAVKDQSGFTLIEHGAFAYGTITQAESAGLFGTGGKIAFSIDSVEAFNGLTVPLTGSKDNVGSNSTGAVVASTLLISPLALFFRGTNAVIQPGTIVRAYVAKTTVLSGDAEVVPGRFSGKNEVDQKLNDLLDKLERKKAARGE